MQAKVFDRDHVEVTVFEPFYQNVATILSLHENSAVHSNFEEKNYPS